jgi:hypothetical protein
MPAFDPDAIIRAARQVARPADWQMLPLRHSAVIWDLVVRLGAGIVLLVVCALVIAGVQPAAGDGAVPYVFAGFALLASLAYLTAAWTPLLQLRQPGDFLLVLTPAGVALAWSGRSIGLPFAQIADVTLHRRSFRAIFGQDLVLTRDDGRQIVLPIGELFGEPTDVLDAVLDGTRRARGQPAPSAE